MNFNKKLAVAVSGAVLLMAGQFALADSATDIVDALVSKGVLTEEEGKLITKGHTSKTAVTPVVKEKDGAFTLESANARNSIQLTGRIHLDYRQNNLDMFATDFNDRDTASTADNFELRRARLGVKGKFAKDFKYEIVGNLPGTATVDVAYIDYAKYDQAQIRVGKFKQPFGLEQLTSSNNIDFMERSYVDQLVPGKKIGAMAFGEPKPGFTYAGSVFAMNDTEQDAKNDKASFAGRATLNFAQFAGNKDMIAHVGLAGFDSEYNITPSNSSASGGATTRGTFLSYRTPGRGLSSVFRAQIGGEGASTTTITTAATCTSSSTGAAVTVSGTLTPTSCAAASGSYTPAASVTGTIQNSGFADPSNSTSQIKSQALGLEGILAYKNFKLQGEFAKADFKAKTGTGSTGVTDSERFNLDTQAWYAEALWLATGEKYADAYKAGTFSSIKPISDFDIDNGKWGAWEFGLKYEEYKVDNMNIALNGSTGNGSRAQGTVSCAQNGTATPTTAQVNAGCESKSRTYTAGIKWILNPNARILANYSRTNFGREMEFYDLDDAKLMKHEDIVMVRTQFAF
jgi:phosphate-selective porin OprO and OprP